MVAEKSTIDTQNAPQAIGPYSQAIAVRSEGAHWVFCSGQIALPASAMRSTVANKLTEGGLVSGSIADEAHQVLQNLREVLTASGCSLQDVVKTTIFLTDLADFAEVNAVYGKFFAAPYPARSTIQVAALPRGARIEIEATALRS